MQLTATVSLNSEVSCETTEICSCSDCCQQRLRQSDHVEKNDGWSNLRLSNSQKMMAVVSVAVLTRS